MDIYNVGVVGDNPFALLLLGLLARYGIDPILIAPGSATAESAQFFGFSLTGYTRAAIERVRFTVCRETPAELPDRGFDYLCVIGGSEVKNAAGLVAFPALVTKRTRVILVENNDDQACQDLEKIFPDQVSKSWAVGGFTITDRNAMPIRVHVQPAPAMYVEIPTDESTPTLKAFVALLRKAGLASFVTQHACTRAVVRVRAASISVQSSTTFVEIGARGKKPTPIF